MSLCYCRYSCVLTGVCVSLRLVVVDGFIVEAVKRATENAGKKMQGIDSILHFEVWTLK